MARKFRGYREPSAYSTAHAASHAPELRPCQCEHLAHLALDAKWHRLKAEVGGCAPHVSAEHFPGLLYICGACWDAHGPGYGRRA
jgi:hypothetical protein